MNPLAYMWTLVHGAVGGSPILLHTVGEQAKI